MIHISGYNDDVLRIDSEFSPSEEIYCRNKRVVLNFLDSDGEGVEIHAWFDGPTWAFSILQLPDEEIDIPWSISVDQDSSYSMGIEIQANSDIKWTHFTEDLD